MAAIRAVIISKMQLLMVQRSQRVRRPMQWCLPGGRIRPGESSADACVREVVEEVGLNAVVIRSLQTISDQEYFLCETKDPTVTLCNRESCAFVWADLSSLEAVGEIMDYRAVREAVRLALSIP